VVVCTRIGSVGDILTDDGPFDVLVAGPSLGTRSGLGRLRIIREECLEMAVVLAFSRRPDASLRDIVRTGAVDLLQLPVDDKEVLAALERALSMSVATEPASAVTQDAQTSTVAIPAPLPPPPEPKTAHVFTISSATGGCGKTFFATNLAYFLTNFTGQRVCIVDLDLQFGEVSTALRLRPKYTIFDALQRVEDDPEVLVNHIEDYTVTHETGVHVLAAPRDPSEADRITPPDVSRILDAVKQRFDWVIVDTPPALTEIVLAAFDLSDELYVLATLDLPSVRNMSVFLGTVERLKIPQDNIRLLLNKAETDVGIDVDQVTKLFPRGFDAVLPYAKEVSRSINLGMPVMAASPSAEVSRLMAGGIKRLLDPEQQVRVDAEFVAKRGGLFRRKK
jgi:pilus assembly protein CpaE